MTEWEYRIVLYKDPVLYNEDEIVSRINETEIRLDSYGKDGWELVRFRGTVVGDLEYLHLVFKRPKE